MYIALGQGHTAPRGQSFDVNRNVLSLRSFVASFKKKNIFKSLILYKFFNDLIHAYSPRPGQTDPQGTKIRCQQKRLVTSFICCLFQKKCLWSLILYFFLNDLIHVYRPGAGADSPQWTKFWCQQKGLITLPICCKFQKSLRSLILYNFFHDLIHV